MVIYITAKSWNNQGTDNCMYGTFFFLTELEGPQMYGTIGMGMGSIAQWTSLGNLPQLDGGNKQPSTTRRCTRCRRLVYSPLLCLRFGCFNVVVAGSAAVAEQFRRAHVANFSSRQPKSSGDDMHGVRRHWRRRRREGVRSRRLCWR
jgi:hypothetical protein